MQYMPAKLTNGITFFAIFDSVTGYCLKCHIYVYILKEMLVEAVVKEFIFNIVNKLISSYIQYNHILYIYKTGKMSA